MCKKWKIRILKKLNLKFSKFVNLVRFVPGGAGCLFWPFYVVGPTPARQLNLKIPRSYWSHYCKVAEVIHSTCLTVIDDICNEFIHAFDVGPPSLAPPMTAVVVPKGQKTGRRKSPDQKGDFSCATRWTHSFRLSNLYVSQSDKVRSTWMNT